MSDEFVKGLGILMAGGLIWMVLSGWYATPSFSGAQLTGAVPEDPSAYGSLALVLRDGVFWFTVLGTLTFWVGIPAVTEAREAWSEYRNA
jgi:hypothetical protein